MYVYTYLNYYSHACIYMLSLILLEAYLRVECKAFVIVNYDMIKTR